MKQLQFMAMIWRRALRVRRKNKEWVSVFRRNQCPFWQSHRCPFSAGIRVRFAQEFMSGFSKSTQTLVKKIIIANYPFKKIRLKHPLSINRRVTFLLTVIFDIRIDGFLRLYSLTENILSENTWQNDKYWIICFSVKQN